MGASNVILVAEDEVMIRNLIQEFLSHEGYKVLTAADGNEALALSRAHQGSIDLFLTDVNMPHLDGISAYQKISAERPNTKVLFISGGTLQSELPEPWPLMSKPFKPGALLGEVSDILKNRRPADGGRPAFILLVDQNEDRKKRTKNILTDNGYTVLTASSVEEAEAVSDRVARIDLIISEVVFSGDSGVQLAERQASGHNIDTLLISHFHRDVLNTVPGFSIQAEFLENPFTPEDLLARVFRLLKK